MDAKSKPLTQHDLDAAVDLIMAKGGMPDELVLPTSFKREWLDRDYDKKCAKFMRYFHKGVSFEHLGSKVVWTVHETFKHSGTGEIRTKCISSNGYKKEISMYQYNDYRVVKVPKAVKILFGEADD